MKIGYKRVSTVIQRVDRQLAGIEFDKTFTEKVSGKSKDRPELQNMLGMIREDDQIHVHELSRLGRNTKDLLEIVEEILSKGARIKFHKENLEFIAGEQQSPVQNLMLTMLSAISQFERELTLDRIREGIAIAKAKGKYLGKKSRFSKSDVAQIKSEFQVSENKAQLAKKHGISRGYLYRLAS
jgi:DNA invertase Pin-like site-specific DNA recombinase